MTFKKGFYSLKNALEKGIRTIGVGSQSASCAAFMLSEIFAAMSRPVIWICPDRENAASRARELELFLPGRVHEFPSYEHLVFLPLIPSPENSARRIAALHNLSENRDTVTVIQASAVSERLIPGSELSKMSEIVMVDEETDRDQLARWLTDTGYEHMTRVERVGEFSVRGEIVDIFPPDHERPVRFLFFDNLIEEIRTFNPETQRTESLLKEVILLPCRETVYSDKNVVSAIRKVIDNAGKFDLSASQVNTIIQNLEARRDSESSLSLLPVIYERLDNIFSYAPEDALLVIEDPLLCQKNMEDFCRRVQESYENQVEQKRYIAEREQYYAPPEEITERLEVLTSIILNPGRLITRRTSSAPVFIRKSRAEVEMPCVREGAPGAGRPFRKGLELFSAFASKLVRWSEEDYRIVICCQLDSSRKRLAGLLEHYEIPHDQLDAGSVCLYLF